MIVLSPYKTVINTHKNLTELLIHGGAMSNECVCEVLLSQLSLYHKALTLQFPSASELLTISVEMRVSVSL